MWIIIAALHSGRFNMRSLWLL